VTFSKKDGAGGGCPSRALRLLAADPLPPLPTAAELEAFDDVRRPGELHEAVPVGDRAAQRLSHEATRLGVSIDVAASLLLETAMVLDDLARVRQGDLIDVAAFASEPTRTLTAGWATYLRSLTIGRRVRPVRAQVHVSVPARLVVRLVGRDVERLLATVPLEVALAWEVEAVKQGRTLTEAVLMSAVREAAYSSDCSPIAASSPPASSPSKRAW
jgi:hypothetical protein